MFCDFFSQDEEGSLELDDEWISEDDWKDLVSSESEDELEQVGYFHFKKEKGIICHSLFYIYSFIYSFHFKDFIVLHPSYFNKSIMKPSSGPARIILLFCPASAAKYT